MDRRVRKSRAAIFGAFEELLRQKSYASITVGDIIETADVGRTTFYAHFQTKDALLDELCKDIFAHVIAPAPEKGHSCSSDSTEEQLLHVLCHLAEQRDRLAPLLASPSSHLFWEAIEGQFVAFFGERIGTSVRIKPGVQDELYAEHLGKTLCEVVRWWFAGKLAEEPKAALAGFLSLTDVSFVTAQGGSHWNTILPLSWIPPCPRRSSAACSISFPRSA
ncbi:TetR/AcrR family transcriptional regulator [Ellagibacter isourolithinifaciens]|uniref:TetR/AcrR family transcriptional regulator n=1 Tax=Ellagibacter isourolithinifaciens TaxID=2137581 RepID=UPI003A94310E